MPVFSCDQAALWMVQSERCFQDAFKFEIINYPDLSGNIPTKPAYGVFTSQVIRYARICSKKADLLERVKSLTKKLLRKHYTINGLKSSLKKLSEETSLDHDQTGPKTSPEPHRRIADPHRRITINILEILELPIFAYHTYYTSKHMYNWMKWLRLLGGWHFIAATAIKPPKAACQFAADDILLYKICYNIQWIYFSIWEKGKEELSPLQYHFKSLHIISRHYKKSLLRSQIYHGYEELSTDTNYPIWRRQKLPYMKKTRKKKQVCGAACFMAAEIKFSEDVRPSVTPFSLCSHHRIIMKFSAVITSDRSNVHAKRSRSKVKVTEVTTQLNSFRTVTPVWIHIWWWNDAYSLIMLRRGALLFFKVIRHISRSHGSKNRQIWPRLGVSGL